MWTRRCGLLRDDVQGELLRNRNFLLLPEATVQLYSGCNKPTFKDKIRRAIKIKGEWLPKLRKICNLERVTSYFPLIFEQVGIYLFKSYVLGSSCSYGILYWIKVIKTDISSPQATFIFICLRSGLSGSANLLIRASQRNPPKIRDLGARIWHWSESARMTPVAWWWGWCLHEEIHIIYKVSGWRYCYSSNETDLTSNS